MAERPSEYLPAMNVAKPQVNPQGINDSLNWVYINGLGERNESKISKTDILSAISFDKTGDYLAVGDLGGRVIVFKYCNLKNSRYFDYRYFTEIQSHEPEFDHLKSIELDEKINSIEFINNNSSAIRMLTTNDKVIKLWKFDYKVHRKVSSSGIAPDGQITIPKSKIIDEGYESIEKT